MDYANFDLRLAGESGVYAAEVLDAPAGQTSGPQAVSGALPLIPDPEIASPAHLEAVGRALWHCAFGAGQVAGLWRASLATAAAAGNGLRLRLAVESAALAAMPWELLCDDALGRFLALDPGTPVVRYVRLPFAAGSWPQDRPLRLLFSGATPLGLPPLRVIKEAAAVAAALTEPIHAGRLTQTAIPTGATLPGLVAALRQGVDIWHFAGHGDQAGLVFEDGAGRAAVVEAGTLGLLLVGEGVRLTVLNACRAGLGGGQATSVAGALVRAGVPAVIAMQGNVTMKTAAAFMPIFFQELRRDGQVDRAASVARGAVRERPDWWMPVLFMRLKSGRIGYKPGFSAEAGGLQKWPALVRNIQAGRCTPIVGPGLTEWLLGSRREIAARWAETFGYPMNPDSQESLPQVAQFLKVNQDVFFMRDELTKHLRGEIDKRFGSLVPPALKDASLDDVISAVGQSLAQDPATLAIRTLAGLPLPIYITTNPSNLLAQALEAAGKKPVVELCRWNDTVEQIPSIFDADREPDYRPTPQRPLVYHLFGRLSEPDSLVITEDDYFDYLIGVTSRNDLIPGVVRRALADSALLFLGFDLDEWDFRVLFRTVMLREGGAARRDYAHVAAQIDPESGHIIEPDGARRYLAEYFGQQAARISIFWGSVADFGRELARQLAKS